LLLLLTRTTAIQIIKTTTKKIKILLIIINISNTYNNIILIFYRTRHCVRRRYAAAAAAPWLQLPRGTRTRGDCCIWQLARRRRPESSADRLICIICAYTPLPSRSVRARARNPYRIRGYNAAAAGGDNTRAHLSPRFDDAAAVW